MPRFLNNKVSTVALLTGAVFTISSLAPIEFAPGPFSSDAAWAGNGNGNGGGNGGGRGGKGGGKAGKGGEKSAATSSRGGGKGSRNRGGKGIGGMFSKATRKGGNLINSVFGKEKARAKAKAKKPASTKVTTAAAPMPKEKKVENLNARMAGLHAANANYHAFMNASPNSRVGKIRAYAEANFAYDAAAMDVADALAEFAAEYPDFDQTRYDELSKIEALDLTPDEQTELADLQAALDSTEGMALTDANTALDEAVDPMEALKEASNKPDEVDDEVKAAVDALLDANGYNGHLQEQADAAAEAAAAEATDAPVVEDDTIVLKTGDGETIALAVE